MSMSKDSFNTVGLVLILLIILGFISSYVTGSKESAEDFSKIVIRAPIDFEIVDCGRKCRDWIEFEHRKKVFKFYQSNPFYSQFEKLAQSDGFLTIWYDETRDNQIYQVSLNRRVIIPFDKLYSVNNFDNSFLFVLPLILLFIGFGRVVMAKS